VSNRAIHAFGTQLLMGDGAVPEVFGVVPELKGIPVPQMEAPRIDVSTHDNDAFIREYVNNLSDMPAVSFDINFLPTDPMHDHETGLLSKQITGEQTNFKVRYNDAVGTGTNRVMLTFPATVTSFRPVAPVDNVYSATVQLQPTAAPVYGSS
jgi:hypothetical protein